MQVNFDTNGNSKNFGVFYGPTLKRVQNVFGKDIYRDYWNILSDLRDLGEKADVHLKVHGYTGKENLDGFQIKVTKITKSGLKRFLGLYEDKKVLKDTVTVAEEWSNENGKQIHKKITTILVDKITDMVKKINE